MASIEQLVSALDEALGSVLTADDYDITVGPEPFIGLAAGEVDCSTDNWTLRVEAWPDGPAWLSVDDEPDPESPVSLFRQHRRLVMPLKVERALRAANETLDGALLAALHRTPDRSTQELAEVLAEAAAS